MGLSLDFELLNLLGFAAYTAFASSFRWSASVQEEYKSRHGGNASKVTVQDLFFAVSSIEYPTPALPVPACTAHNQ